MTSPVLISTAAFDGYDLEVALGEVASLGVEFVELAFIEGYTDPFTEEHFSGQNADKIARSVERSKLSCLSVSAHMDLSRDDAVAVFSRRMRFARAVGAQYVLSNAAPRDRETLFMGNMQALAALAEELGLKIALENPGDGRDNVLNTARSAASVIQRIGSPRVQMNYDFGNLLSHCFERVRPEDDYKHALECTAYYHIKDVAADSKGWRFTEIGKGSIDYSGILTELKVLPKPVPLSLEIPLRITRAPDASPRRAPAPIPLDRIRRVLAGSLAFVRKALQP